MLKSTRNGNRYVVKVVVFSFIHASPSISRVASSFTRKTHSGIPPQWTVFLARSPSKFKTIAWELKTHAKYSDIQNLKLMPYTRRESLLLTQHRHKIWCQNALFSPSTALKHHLSSAMLIHFPSPALVTCLQRPSHRHLDSPPRQQVLPHCLVCYWALVIPRTV